MIQAVIAVMGCLLLATYVAMEMTYFSFESTFVQYSRYNMSEADAAVLSSTTSAVFTITRGMFSKDMALNVIFHFDNRCGNFGVSEDIFAFNTFNAFRDNHCLQFDGNIHI